jgi:hypothetical protein
LLGQAGSQAADEGAGIAAKHRPCRRDRGAETALSRCVCVGFIQGTIMSFLLKDPDAVLDYEVDWSADYLGTDVLSASEWSVSPAEPTGLAVLEQLFDGGLATVKASGGVAGHVYRLTNQVELESGLRDSRSVVIRVEAR